VLRCFLPLIVIRHRIHRRVRLHSLSDVTELRRELPVGDDPVTLSVA
jgi:hypothetical protein